MSRIQQHPYLVPQKGIVKRFARPSTVGALTAAAFALNPRVGQGLQGALVDQLVKIPGLGRLPYRIYALLAGFSAGYVISHCINWLRWRTLRRLFQYTGWLQDQKSAKTKIWALLVKLLKGPAPYTTHEFQDILPHQPLPDLKETLERWTSSAQSFLTEEEFAQTKQAADEFLVNEGPKLQEYLRNKAKKCVSWLSDYWLQAAYLAGREPLAVNSNYLMANTVPEYKTIDQNIRAAEVVATLCKCKALLDSQSLQPVQLQELVPVCMQGSRNLFGCNRIPGEHMDSITKFSNSEHIVVMRKGHYFKLNITMKDKRGQSSYLTAEELKLQIDQICAMADGLEETLKVADLTSQNRTVWCKHREILTLNNKETLHEIESSLFMVHLADGSPKDSSELSRLVLTGQGGDRWFDKCFTLIVYNNGSLAGFNVEHSLLDATVFTILAEYMMVHESYDNGGLVKDPSKKPRDLPRPQKLDWKLAGIEDLIKTATEMHKKICDDVDLILCYPSYGKRYMKQKRISPDGYIQTVLQLAYYRLHKGHAKTYEPATGRLFQLGRTETVHPSSPHTVKWVKCMDDQTVSKTEKIELLRAAVKHQNNYRLDCTGGHGCDRHLLGLYCASREMGMDIPKLFMDKAWRENFVLSTSQTPTRSFEYGLDYNWPYCSGGFGPSCHEGYGVSYVLFGEDIINIVITSWHSNETTSSKKLNDAIVKAMDDVKELLA